MLYTLNLRDAIFQLYSHKAGKKNSLVHCCNYSLAHKQKSLVPLSLHCISLAKPNF